MEDPREVEFFIKLREKLEEIQDLVDDHGFRDKFVSAWLFGLEQDTRKNRVSISAMAGMNVSGLEELEVALSHIIDQYEEDEDDPSNIDFWLN